MKIAYLGPEGTYTEDAVKFLDPSAARVPCGTINDVFRAVAENEVSRGLVPFENVIQGPVTETLDNLFQYSGDLNIVGMVLLPIQHAIGALASDKSGIKRILSKDQALKQCSIYLAQNFSGAELVECSSTARAMDDVVQQCMDDAAAVGSRLALEERSLHILDTNIGNVKNNKTKFAVLGKYHSDKTGNDATALAIYPHRDRKGILKDMVDIISGEYNLNMSSIHSRPDTKGGFRFYIEIEGHREDNVVADCITSLIGKFGEDDVEVKVFGSYPKKAFVEPQIKTIGIIGGTGKMGGWFRPFFEKAGYTVLVSGRKTELTYKGCIEKSDVVLVNIPIRATVGWINSYAGYLRPGQLIVDNSADKIQPVMAMLGAAPEGVEVLGMHTIFGQKIDTLRGENIIFMYTPRSGDRAQEFENIFYKHGAKIKRATISEQDTQMAFHQNLEHLTKVVLAELIRTKFGRPEPMEAFSSPNSRATIATMGRVLSLEPELAAEMVGHNLMAPEIIRAYLEIANRIGQALIKGDTAPFEESMKWSREYFGEEFIKAMVERTKGKK